MARQPVYGRTEWERIVSERRRATMARILQLGAEGHTDHEIANTMHYSVDTIKGWWTEIRHQLGARNRTHACVIAVREGII